MSKSTRTRLRAVDKSGEAKPNEAQPTPETPSVPTPFMTLGFDRAATIIMYNAASLYFQQLSTAQGDTGSTMKVLADIMATMKPAAQVAAQQLKTEGSAQPA